VNRYLVECLIDPGELDLLGRTRAEHYAFLLENRHRIVFGGPARGVEDGPPETMVIVVEAASLDEAQAFIAGEPYNRGGGFDAVRVRPWSQVLPEIEPDGLRRTYQAELAGRRANADQATRGSE
jgi:uncharacterized protein YciI